MGEKILKQKTFNFAIRIVNLYKYLVENTKEFVLSKQILRSGTAIGALLREAEFGQTKKDFIHKLSIAQKEANETLYWLELLNQTKFIDDIQFKSLNEDAIELMKMLTASIKTAKKNLDNTNH